MSMKENEDMSEDMSMEEILASIRKYVSTTEKKPSSSKVIHLTEEMMESKQNEPKNSREIIIEDEPKEDNKMMSTKEALAKLKCLKTQKTKEPTLSEVIEKIAEPMIQKWIDQNLPQIVERMIKDQFSED